MATSPASGCFHPRRGADPQRRTLRRPGTVLAVLLAGLCAAAVPAVTVSAAPPPTIGDMWPIDSVESGGATANLLGHGFTGTTAVRFGGVAASNVQVVNDSQLTAHIPAHSPKAVVHVTVTAAGGTSQPGNADRFAYYTDLGGGLSAAPDAASWGGGRLDAFGRRNDNALGHRWRQGGQWGAWESLGGVLGGTPGMGVGAVAWGPGRIDVFVQGTDHGLWHRWWDGAKWNGWEPLGGILASGPDVASWSAGRLDVFTRGSDNGLWHKWWDGIKWNSWEPLGGGLTSDPGAVSWAAHRIDVFVRGTDNGLWHKWWDGAQWGGWEGLGGHLVSGPDPASPGPGQLDVIYRDNGPIYGRAYTGAWQPARSLQWLGSSDPGAVASGPGVSDIFQREPGLTLGYTNTTAAS
ncbi:MAG: hypothetical protein DLM67_09920 [Candidatus Nephthysia bennettiae]|uniref:IPT/TIG domain-containing protein n=1 Tax=Candidatus Nephthysia bennettiae TaxID=3127016 RepID=A0A934KD21_9BACT|nr:IPT/TIG domain-containing protein [Candidatus Dormibacteraeota bacterium]MBJ7613219.1 IPT/TIG domain-containing protein [Candidatus Dormibacteraeota bacterium]PZR96039.1 MAG: hypothetical protein DLM67_09920 [Candidatus Dormibacteraeota bacterium]